jgi:hypothetical protein
MALTEIQKQALDRIKVLRQLEQRTGRSYGPVEKRVLADLNRTDVLAVIDALIEVGGDLAGYQTTEVSR